MTQSGFARWILALGLALVAACSGGGEQAGTPTQGAAPQPVANPVDPATAGRISGTVTFGGAVPKPEAIKMSSDPNCEKTGSSTVSETLLVGDEGALENVFVYIKDGLGTRTFPVPSTPVILDQKGCHYLPHVFGVQVGQPVEIVNSDATLHNVHAMAQSNREFNAGQPFSGMKMTHTFTTREVMVPFKCDVHRWMNAWVGVLDHPYFSVSGKNGAFTLNGVPPGTYTIEAWHEKLGTQTQTVTVGEKDSKSITFTFKG